MCLCILSGLHGTMWLICLHGTMWLICLCEPTVSTTAIEFLTSAIRHLCKHHSTKPSHEREQAGVMRFNSQYSTTCTVPLFRVKIV